MQNQISQIAIPTSSDVSLIDQFERELARVTDAAEAEQLWRMVNAVDVASRMVRLHANEQLRFGKLKLRAERRWGELLGAAEHGGDRTEQLTASKLKPADHTARHRAREVAAVPEQVFEAYVGKANDPETLRRARLLRVSREDAAEKRREEPIEQVTADGLVEIRHGNLRVALDDLVGQVDAIITDPPYPAEFLDEFDALGDLAARLLRPGGLLVVMVGQSHLPEYLRRLCKHLAYRWCGAYLMEGPAVRIHGRKVGAKWKPLLIFGGETFITQDVFQSRGDDKEHHHWGQSESGMADIVSRLTESGQLVVDPFLGGGTTAIVCRELGRRFVGCDIDANAVATTRERLAV